MATYELRKKLYEAKGFLTNWPVSVNMQSSAGVASLCNKTQGQKSKMSVAGYALDKLVSGRASVCRNTDNLAPMAYVELASSDGNVYSYSVFSSKNADATRGFDVVTTDRSDSGRIAQAIFLAMLFSPGVRSGIVDSADDMATVEECLKYFNPDGPFDTQTILINNVFRLCDWFYYGVAANRSVHANAYCATDKLDASPYIEVAARIQQSGGLEHVDGTAEPSLYKPTAKKKAARQQPSLFTEPLEVFFGRCKKGEFVIDYNWPDKQKQDIVPLSFLDTFFPTESFRLMLISVWKQIQNVQQKIKDGLPYGEIIGKNPINVKVMGKPGTGKTTVIEAVLASLGYPKGLINCKDRMEEDEIEGQNKFINGSVWNVPTKAVQMHSYGGAVVLEEFNLPDPGILQGALGQALAYPFILKEDGYKELKRHPLTVYFATMNIGVAGTKPMNEALSSRFPEGYIIEDVKEDEFVGILADAGYKKGDCRKVYRVYQKVLNYLREYHEDLVLSLTLRHCLNALDKLKIGFTEAQAYETTFLSQLYSSDPDVAEDVQNTVLKAVA